MIPEGGGMSMDRLYFPLISLLTMLRLSGTTMSLSSASRVLGLDKRLGIVFQRCFGDYVSVGYITQ